MKYTNALLSVLLCLIIPTTLFSLSEEEKLMFDMISNLKESELQELIQTIDSEVGKMSETEQKEFWNAVEAEASRLEPQISQYMQEQEPALSPQQEATKKPIQKKKPKKKKPKQEQKKPEKDTVKSSYKMLSDLITSIDNLLCITQTIPQFDQELEDWAEEGLLKHWQSGLTWSFFKDQITTLSYKLRLLIAQDSQEQYKYLGLLIEDTALYTTIQQLQHKIDSAGHLQNCSLETETLSLQSEQTIQSMVSSLYEAINMLHIIGSIDTLINKYKPIGEQLKQEELELQEQARQAGSSIPRYQAPTTAGKEVEPSGFVSIPEYERPRTSSLSLEPLAPTRQTPQSSLLDRQRKTTERGQPSPQPLVQKSPQDKKKSTLGKKETQETQKSVSEKKDTDKLSNKVADGYLTDLDKSLDAAMVTIEDAKLQGIKNHVLGHSGVNTDLVFYIPQVNSQVKKAATSARALKLRTKKFKGAQKTKYTTAIRNSIQPYTKTLNGIANQIRDIRKSEASVTDEKAYAYLGGIRKDNVASLAQKVPNPANLYVLETNIRELLSVK